MKIILYMLCFKGKVNITFTKLNFLDHMQMIVFEVISCVMSTLGIKEPPYN